MQLIEAMKLLTDLPQLKLLVIGSSFYGSGERETPFIQDVKKEAEALQGRICFTGFVPYADMPSYLHTADVAVVPSVWDDPLPTTVIEAQAAGLPVISTRRGGIPEEVSAESAILLDTDDCFVQSLSGAIRYLYEHADQRRQMGQAALAHSKRFAKDRFAHDFFAALETILSH